VAERDRHDGIRRWWSLQLRGGTGKVSHEAIEEERAMLTVNGGGGGASMKYGEGGGLRWWGVEKTESTEDE
jgi:hypothetical protein